MRDELKRLLAQEIGRGSIDCNDLMRTVLVELASAGDADLPSQERIACIVAELSNGVLSSAEDEAIARGVSDLFRPVIAAQRARIAELEQRGERVVELELTNEGNRQRIAELEAMRTEDAAAASKAADQVDEMRKRIAELEKRSAQTPVDATGKAPEEVYHEVYVYEYGPVANAGPLPWRDVSVECRRAIRLGCQAVLRVFGGAEVLRRVRERIAGLNGDRTDPWIMKPDVLSIIDELAKTNEPHR